MSGDNLKVLFISNTIPSHVPYKKIRIEGKVNEIEQTVDQERIKYIEQTIDGRRIKYTFANCSEAIRPFKVDLLFPDVLIIFPNDEPRHEETIFNDEQYEHFKEGDWKAIPETLCSLIEKRSFKRTFILFLMRHNEYAPYFYGNNWWLQRLTKSKLKVDQHSFNEKVDWSKTPQLLERYLKKRSAPFEFQIPESLKEHWQGFASYIESGRSVAGMLTCGLTTYAFIPYLGGDSLKKKDVKLLLQIVSDLFQDMYHLRLIVEDNKVVELVNGSETGKECKLEPKQTSVLLSYIQASEKCITDHEVGRKAYLASDQGVTVRSYRSQINHLLRKAKMISKKESITTQLKKGVFRITNPRLFSIQKQS